MAFQEERAAAGLARDFLPPLAESLRRGRVRLTLVAGMRADVAAAFRRALERCGVGEEPGRSVEVLHVPDLPGYLARFADLLAAAAWAGYALLPTHGTFRIAEVAERLGL
ncbi:MAG: hypothetical protein AB2L07_08665 [Thermoanaerobaculaceae bacterium]